MNNPNGGPKDLNEFIKEYRDIQSKGFIRTHRPGPTGVGKTLEDLLDIKENDKQYPDFDEYELKSKRINKRSLLTLITKKPDGAGGNKKLLDLFGYKGKDGFRELHVTLTYGKDFAPENGPHKMGLKFVEQRLYVTIDGKIIDDVYWDVETLRRAIKDKYISEKVVFAGAESRGTKENEEFYYKTAVLAKGVSPDNIINLFKEGKITIDFRIGHYHSGRSKGKLHDHGTGFRISEANQDLLFKDLQDLMAEYNN